MSEQKIIQGDCLDVLKEMEANTADAFITDPPYGINFQSNMRVATPKLKKIANDKAPFTAWLPDAYRVTKEGGSLLCFCRWDVEHDFYLAIQAAGYTVKSRVIWDRGTWGTGDLKAQFAPRHDTIWFAIKGKFEFPNGRPCDVIEEPRVPPGNLRHPNEKPVVLMAKLILAVTRPGDLVVDPFSGSGATGVACVPAGRNFIGIELSSEYVDLGRRRIAEAQMQYLLPMAY